MGFLDDLYQDPQQPQAQQPGLWDRYKNYMRNDLSWPSFGGAAEPEPNAQPQPNIWDRIMDAPTIPELASRYADFTGKGWDMYKNFMRNDLPWPGPGYGGDQDAVLQAATKQGLAPEPRNRYGTPTPPPPAEGSRIGGTPAPPPPAETIYKQGFSPREKALAAQGFTNYAPGVSWRDDSKLQGPQETRSAFGQTYQVPRSGGTASMMQISGTTPTAERLSHEAVMRQLNMKGDEAAAQARIRTAEAMPTPQRPDAKVMAFKRAQEIINQRKADGDSAEQRYRAEWAAANPGTEPPSDYVKEARRRAESRYDDELAIIQSTLAPSNPMSGGVQPDAPLIQGPQG